MPHDDLELNRWFLEHVKPHEEMLRAWLAARFAHVLEIDDVVQEAFLRVLKARQKAAMKSPKAFLFATARNLALDMLKHSSVSKTEYMEASDLSEFEDFGMGVSETVAHNQELEIMREALKSLPPRCRQVFTMRQVHGMPVRDISSELQISKNTVTALLSKGLRKFTTYVDRYCAKGDRL